MTIYLLATNLFTVAALLLGGASFIKNAPVVRLVPLFLLVVSQSLALIFTIAGWDDLGVVGALQVFSALCLVWALIGSVAEFRRRWQWLIWSGVAWMAGLVLLSVLPFWPVPPAIHILFIAIFGASLIFITADETPWLHITTPLVLAVAAGLSVLELDNTASFISLLAYVVFLATIHWQSLKIYTHREHVAQELVQEAVDFGQVQQQFVEASDLLCNVPNLNHPLDHIVRSVAQIIHCDQCAIFIPNSNFTQEIQLATLYSPQRPFHISEPDDITCLLPDNPLLEQVMTEQRQLYLQGDEPELRPLYQLWAKDLRGPTLLQPLLIQGRSVGVLFAGNPLNHNPIPKADRQLCSHLAGQIALMVAQRHRYLKLEREAEVTAKEAKTRAEAPNQQFSATLEKISDGVVVSNTAGRVEFVNQAAERILGKARQTLLGQPIGLIYRQIDSKVPTDNFMLSFAERVYPLPTFIEDEAHAIQGRMIPWRGPSNEWLGIIAIFRDVSREVKADQARNDFIATLSQELRAPLTTVKGYSELIMHGMIGEYPPQQLHVQQIIHNGSERVVEILDNAIKMSSENRHRILPRFEEVDVPRIIEGVMGEIRQMVEQNELTLYQEIEADLPPLAADVKHLHRILYNLFSNACRFTPPGGSITIKAQVRQDNLGRQPQPYLYLSVIDNGVGIAKEDLARIFDRFYQVKRFTTKNGENMGVGLTTVKELVELHHGRVWGESVVGRGSKFHIALPVNQDY